MVVSWSQDTKLTTADIKLGAEMRSRNMSWRSIADALGCSLPTIRKQLDATYASKIRAQHRKHNKRYYETKLAGFVTHTTQRQGITPEEADRIIRAIEPDLRSPMAKFMGDPAPGRSALDRRLKNNSTPVDKSPDFVAEPKCPLHLIDRQLNEAVT